ncbi:hypothetical protein F4808DRAFT_283787 [Astrocystis sublimbata]|nr:hypothetical protein F4808DRAFT_283787 [Astrocystis sublimbata]
MGVMDFFTSLAGVAAPLFLIASPILSYADQAMSMHRAKSSAGFSLDIPLIMLVASIFRIFFYPGAKYDVALLVQSFVNVFMQVILLKIALDNRPSSSSRGGDAGIPFTAPHEGLTGFSRPLNFWRWRSSKPYWQFLLGLTVALLVLELLISPFDSIYPAYSSLTGVIGLSVEATLPLPQLYINAQSGSCRGFRFSLLASWIAGDSMKMFWFFTSESEIPLAFKLCGVFQAMCDALIGVQYFIYRNRAAPVKAQKDWELAETTSSSNWQTPVGRRTPSTSVGEKSYH